MASKTPAEKFIPAPFASAAPYRAGINPIATKGEADIVTGLDLQQAIAGHGRHIDIVPDLRSARQPNRADVGCTADQPTSLDQS